MNLSDYWNTLANFLIVFKDNPEQVLEDIKYMDKAAFAELQLSVLDTLPK